jgi:sec-independent protein translocase protein TatB
MLNIGFSELAIICIVLIIAVGPERLPSMMKTLGKTIRTLRQASRDIRASTGIDELLREDFDLYQLPPRKRPGEPAPQGPQVTPPPANEPQPVSRQEVIDPPLPVVPPADVAVPQPMAAANVPSDALMSGMTTDAAPIPQAPKLPDEFASHSPTLIGGMSSAPHGNGMGMGKGAAADGGKTNGTTSTLPPPPAPAGSAAPVPAMPANNGASDEAPRPRSLSVPPPRTDSTLAGIAPPAAAPAQAARPDQAEPPDEPHQS